MITIKINAKKYSSKIIFEDVDIEISENGIYGFFGKNGQGKTTFFNCILGFTKYDGEILFNNNELKSSEIAWVPTEPDLYEYLTVKEFMDFYAVNSGKKTMDTNNNLFDLEPHKLIKECSTGTKKKIYINSVLQVSNYKIYVFDEPFNGLDIESNYLLLNYIKRLAESNIVSISSHIIEIVLPYLKHCYFINETKILKLENNDLMNNFSINA